MASHTDSFRAPVLIALRRESHGLLADISENSADGTASRCTLPLTALPQRLLADAIRCCATGRR